MPAPPRTARSFRGLDRSGVAAATLAALALCAGCSSVQSGHPDAAAPAPASLPTVHPAPSDPAPTTSGAPFAVARMYRVHSDRSGFVVTSRQGTATQQWRATTQTWTRTYVLRGSAAAPVILAVAGPGASFIECVVSVRGSAVARIKAGGPDAKVQCS